MTNKLSIDVQERMDGLVKRDDLLKFKTIFHDIHNDLEEQGFDEEDIVAYLKHIMNLDLLGYSPALIRL